MGFDVGRRFSPEDLKSKLDHGVVVAIERPAKIEDSEGVWIDTNNNVVISDYDNPIDDINRRTVHKTYSREALSIFRAAIPKVPQVSRSYALPRASRGSRILEPA